MGHLLWLHTSISCLVFTFGYGLDYITLDDWDLSVILSLFSYLK